MRCSSLFDVFSINEPTFTKLQSSGLSSGSGIGIMNVSPIFSFRQTDIIDRHNNQTQGRLNLKKKDLEIIMLERSKKEKSALLGKGV